MRMKSLFKELPSPTHWGRGDIPCSGGPRRPGPPYGYGSRGNKNPSPQPLSPEYRGEGLPEQTLPGVQRRGAYGTDFKCRGNGGRGLLALAVLALVPALAAAENLTFVNDTASPVVIQLATVVRGGVRRDRPYSLYPGEKVRVSLPGPKLINVYDARVPNRVLLQGPLPASNDDQAFSIRPDPQGLPRLTLQPVPVPKAR